MLGVGRAFLAGKLCPFHFESRRGHVRRGGCNERKVKRERFPCQLAQTMYICGGMRIASLMV
jgi:hypothetical protein